MIFFLSICGNFVINRIYFLSFSQWYLITATIIFLSFSCLKKQSADDIPFNYSATVLENVHLHLLKPQKTSDFDKRKVKFCIWNKKIIFIEIFIRKDENTLFLLWIMIYFQVVVASKCRTICSKTKKFKTTEMWF